MKKIIREKTVENYDSDYNKKDPISLLNQVVYGEWEIRNGVVNVFGDLILANSEGTTLAEIVASGSMFEEKKEKFLEIYGDIEFGTVEGNFDCSNNSLTSLKGCPKTVFGEFDCSSNRLRSLKGCPKKVGGKFDCSYNELSSLEYSPLEVNDYFICSGNQLLSLEFSPETVELDFDCSDNNLTSLEGSPAKVGWSFDCSDNNLTSLEGSPIEIGEDFICKNNPIPEGIILYSYLGGRVHGSEDIIVKEPR